MSDEAAEVPFAERQAWKSGLEEGERRGRYATFSAVVAFLRKPSEYGDPCSADREVLAQQIERGEHLK